MISRIAIALLLVAAPAAAQPPAAKYGWAPKPVSAPYIAPNRAHWKLADLLKAHRTQPSWSQTLVRDPDGLTGAYIQTAPGETSRKVMYSDTVVFFIVQSGQLRVVIDGIEPFIATKGFLVQIPSLRFFQVETLGNTPALRFEITQTQAPPIYAIGEKPAPLAGRTYARVGYYSGPAAYDGNKPYIDYNKEMTSGPTIGARAVQDDFVSASITRGAAAQPSKSDKGHFHIGSSEFWFVMEGAVDYRIEGQPGITAHQGDIVYAPAGRWHRVSLGGSGMAAHVSIHPVGNALEALDPGQFAP